MLVREAIRIAEHRLGAGPGKTFISGLDIVNEAGRFLFSMRDWSFALRPPIPLGIVNAQQYIDVPVNFAKFMANGVFPNKDAINRSWMKIATLQDVCELRARSLTLPAGIYYGAMVGYEATDPPGGAPTMRVEVYPTPVLTDPNAFLMAYFGKWIDRTSEEHNVPIPPNLEGLFRYLVRECAAGYENEVEMSIWDRLAAIESSPLYMAAAREDKMQQPSLGSQPGGAVALQQMILPPIFYPQRILTP